MLIALICGLFALCSLVCGVAPTLTALAIVAVFGTCAGAIPSKTRAAAGWANRLTPIGEVSPPRT